MNLLLGLALALSLQDAATDASRAHAFVDVNVLTMEAGAEALAHRTVVVRDGRISAIGPATEIALEVTTLVIDGADRWLLPGLADMHVHAWSEDDLALFLVNGVTFVRNLFGSPVQLAWRAEIEAGERLGPEIRTAGPIVDGDPPVWPGSSVVSVAEGAREVVAAQRAAGYDFVKVYARLSLESYDAVVAAARAEDLPVEGHVPTAVGLAHVLASGQRSIEHLDGYDRMLEADDSPTRDRDDFLSRAISWNHVDPARLPAAAEASRDAGAWNCPTLVVLQKWKGGDAAADERAAPHLRYLPATTRAAWERMAGTRVFRGAEVRAGDANRRAFVGALHAAGARLLVGTDAGNPWVAPGFALHDELANFVAAGVPPLETLRIATRGAAEFSGRAADLGTVTVGKRADLILVDANPLDDLATLRRPRGVMLRGRWLDRARLDAMLAELEERNAPSREKR